MAAPIKPDRSEAIFEDYKPALSEHGALLEANRCLYCEDAPCTIACPTGIDVAQFIRKIATGNIYGSAKTIFESNILGMSCSRVCPVEVLCAGSCVYNELHESPIAIGKLQRYTTDIAFEKQWRFFEAGEDSGKSVALIGAGPASLACAHELRRQGHACTIYEKREVVGGLNTTGVAPYKMKADRSVEEVAWILEIGGIDVQCGVEIGKDISWAELEARHDAIFLGFGLGPDSVMGLEGEDLEGVQGAVEFIEEFKLEQVNLTGVEHALVIGGGNTALDMVRELVRLGAPRVSLVYRGSEERMTGYTHEWAAGKLEGVTAHWQTQPVAFVGDEHGKVTAARCVRYNADKKPIGGTEHDIPADRIYLAIGQGKLGALVQGLEGVQTQWGCVVIDEHGATGRAGVWAGGDCANGGKEVVNAAAEGKAAAQAMHTYMMGEQ